MDLIGSVIVLLVLAWLAEAVSERLFELFGPGIALLPAPWQLLVKAWVATVVAVILAFAIKLDIFEFLKLQSQFPAMVGYVITGVLVGRGSNWLHEWLAKRPQRGTDLPPASPPA